MPVGENACLNVDILGGLVYFLLDLATYSCRHDTRMHLAVSRIGKFQRTAVWFGNENDCVANGQVVGVPQFDFTPIVILCIVFFLIFFFYRCTMTHRI